MLAHHPILVFGTTGQIAREIARYAAAGSASLIQVGREIADLTRPDEVREVFAQVRPRVVINVAGYTAVDRAEQEDALAMKVNGVAPGVMAEAAREHGCDLIHVSTDYVFNGQDNGSWLEDATTAPLSVYGRTKAAGEAQIRARWDRHVILRTAWVFSAFGSNFVKTMLRLAGERDALRVVSDQKGGPTPAARIAESLLTITQTLIDRPSPSLFGTFHYGGVPSTSWHGFAEVIFEKAAVCTGRHPVVHAIETSDYPTPATRPRNSVLDCTKIGRVYGVVQPDWRSDLGEVIRELLSSKGQKE